MILETYAPESSRQSQLICKDLQHSSRSGTRPNPMTEVEFLFEDLFLVEVSHVVIEPLQQVLGSTVDAYKWTLVRHLDEVFRFKLLKRHFQFQLYITHDSTWQRVSYSSTIEEELNRFQERTRLSRYCLRLRLNPGITPTNCGRP